MLIPLNLDFKTHLPQQPSQLLSDTETEGMGKIYYGIEIHSPKNNLTLIPNKIVTVVNLNVGLQLELPETTGANQEDCYKVIYFSWYKAKNKNKTYTVRNNLAINYWRVSRNCFDSCYSCSLNYFKSPCSLQDCQLGINYKFQELEYEGGSIITLENYQDIIQIVELYDEAGVKLNFEFMNQSLFPNLNENEFNYLELDSVNLPINSRKLFIKYVVPLSLANISVYSNK